MGRLISVEGQVQQVMCSPRACLLSFEAGWSGLIAAIPSTDVARFPDPKATFERRNVRLRGVVEDRAGKLRIELTDPSRIEVLDEEAGEGSRVLSTEKKPPTVTDPAAPAAPADGGGPTTRVQVTDARTAPGGSASSLGTIVRDLQDEGDASVGGTGAGTAAVRGLRERMAIQSQTIRDLEGEIQSVTARLRDLETRPVEAAPRATRETVPEIEPWVVPARSNLADPRPRTGWSTDRLVREVGPPIEVSSVTRDRELWVYEGGKAVTVARGRVVSSTGF